MKSPRILGTPWHTALLVLVVALARSGIAQEEEKPTQEQLDALYERWTTEKLVIPPAALDVRPFDPKTIKLAREFVKTWKQKHRHVQLILNTPDAYWRRRKTYKPDPQPPPTPESALPECEPVVEALRKLADRPDYDLEVFGFIRDIKSDGDLPEFQAAPLLETSALIRTMLSLAVDAGDVERAGTLVALADRLPLTNGYSDPVSRATCATLIVAAVLQTITWFKPVHDMVIAPRGQKPAADQFERAGNLLEQMEKSIGPERTGTAETLESILDPDPWIACGDLAELRNWKRRGAEVQADGKTRAQLRAEVLRAHASYIRRVALPAAKGKSTRRALDAAIAKNTKHASDLEAGDETARRAAFQKSITYPMDQLVIRMKVSRVKFQQQEGSPFAQVRKFRKTLREEAASPPYDNRSPL